MISALLRQALSSAITKHLLRIEDSIKNYGLELPQITLIARDPKKPGMVIIVSTEAPDKWQEALDQARNAK